MPLHIYCFLFKHAYHYNSINPKMFSCDKLTASGVTTTFDCIFQLQHFTFWHLSCIITLYVDRKCYKELLMGKKRECPQTYFCLILQSYLFSL